jgi:hypothetical protein
MFSVNSDQLTVISDQLTIHNWIHRRTQALRPYSYRYINRSQLTVHNSQSRNLPIFAQSYLKTL